ncbi:MAG: hypothetical protein ABJE95_09365 [Byssovorax sp.]
MSRRRRCSGALILVASLAVTAPRSALAQSASDVETARALFVEGAKVANEGRWKEARELYARSLQLKAAPITRYSLGVAQRETGHLADALSSFRAFLAEPETPGTARFTAPAKAAVTALEARISRIVITVEPRAIDGLSLTIDGQPVPPTSDGPRDIDAGGHDVLARAPGFRSGTAHFVVAEGAGAAVTINLAPTTAPTASKALVRPLDIAAPVDAPPPPSAAPSRVLPFTLLGVGGALFVGGTTLGLVGVSQASNAPTRDGSAAHAAQAKGIAGDLLAGAGIATAGIGLILLLSRGTSSAAPPRASGSTVSVTGSGIAVQF